MSKLKNTVSNINNRGISAPAMQFKERGMRNWFHQALIGGRLGDKRGYIAHGKAKTKTSAHNLIT